MHNPPSLKLLAGLAVVCFSACQCGPPEPALLVVINFDPGVPASCVVLEASSGGTVQLTQELTRTKDKNSYRIGIKKQQLPGDLQLVARSYTATTGAGCAAPRFQTSGSTVVEARFPRSGVETFTLELRMPGADLDADRDGYIALAKGGGDCDDLEFAVHPGAAAACGSSVDNDCDGQIGCADSECSSTAACAQTAAGLAFVTTAAPVTAGSCSPALTVELRDASAAPVAAAADTQVGLGVTPPGGVLLYSDPTCLTAVTQLTIPTGQSRASFHFQAAAAGTFDATATVAGLTPASQTQTVVPPVATQLVFTSSPVAVGAGGCSAQLTLETRDATGAAAPQPAGASIALSSNQSGLAFFSDPLCASPLANDSLPIAAGASSASFHVRPTLAQPTTLTATLAALPPATQALTVTAGTATRLAFATSPQGVQSGVCSSVVTVETRDAAGNPSPVAAATTIALSTSGVPLGLFSDSNCTVAITAPIALAPGVGSIGFHFSGTTIGMATILANSAGLTPASQVESVGVGAPAKLVLSAAQSITAGQCSLAAQVELQDSNSNPSNAAVGGVPVALGGPATGFAFYSDPGCATALTTPLTISGGTASATFYFRGTVAGAHPITASSASLSPGAQVHTVIAGAPSVLVFTSPVQSQLAGTCAQFDLEARDGFGNPSAPSAPATVTLGSTPAIAFSTAAGCAASAGSVSLAGSQVTFFASSTVAGDKALTATAPFAAAQQTYTVTPEAAARLGFTVQPTTAGAGSAIAPAVQVAVQDSFGNTVTGSTAVVTIALGTNPGTGVLAGTLSATAVAGVAAFSTLSINRPGTGYTLAASSGTLAAATSAAFNIDAGPAAQLAFSVQPTNAVAGASIAPAVRVVVQDALGNTVTGSTQTVTIGLGANPGAGVLAGTLSVAAVAGVASFADLSINRTGTGYTLAASAGTLTGATSAAFNITAGPAAALAFAVQPSVTAAGAAIVPAPQVEAVDALGNRVTSYTANVTVAIGTNPSAGTLSGTKAVSAVAGVATFPGLSINRSGTGYTLAATAGGGLAGTSAGFEITAGVPTQLAFTVQPTSTTSGAAITPAVQVSIRDALGNLDTSSTASVTIAIANNPGAGTLGGTLTVAAVGGVATFSTLSIDKVGTGYTLGASSGALTAATSTAFAITFGAAAQLAFTVQPAGAVAGVTFAPNVQVTVRDAQGNTVTNSTASITLAIATNPGAGVLSGTLTRAAASGVVSFTGLSINKTGAGYSLSADSTGLAGAISSSFNITPAAASRLTFQVQPATASAGVAISPSPQVAIEDALGNRITGSTANVVMAIGTNPGAGALSGTLTVAAVAGVATFPGLSINKVGTGYTLTASSAGLTAATSTAFDITPGAAAAVVFSVQPVSSISGVAIAPAVQVAVKDAFNNTVTGSVASITVAIGANPAAGVLAGTLTAAAVAGVATFSNLAIDKAGTGYTLTASSTGLTGATSSAFNITAGPAAQLAFTVQPGTTIAGVAIAPSVQVTVQDAVGNTITGSTASITVAIGTNPSAGVLSGTLTRAAAAGVATFTGLSINKAGAGYTLTATSAGVTAATSTGFEITPAAAARVSFVVQPASAIAGQGLSPSPQVAIEDAFGNRVTSSTANVTVAIGTNPSAGVLSGTLTVAAVAGVATFPGLSIDKAGTGYTFAASSAALTGATSTAFDITAGVAAALAFSVQPASATAAVAIAPAVQVAVKDAFGNTVTGSTASITVAIGTNPAAGVLSGTLTVAATAGVATFSNLSIDKAGTGYTLTASSGTLSAATSTAFNIVAGAAVRLVILGSPLTVPALACSSIRTVGLEDAGGNPTTSTGNTVVVYSAAPAAATTTFWADPACTVGLTNGNRTISNGGTQVTFYFKAQNATDPVTLTATSSPLTPGTQTATIAAAVPTDLAFTTAAPTVEAGFCQPLTLERRDALGRPTNPLTLTSITLASSPATGILFFSDPGCLTPLAASFDILASSSSTVIYVKGISGSLAGTAPGSQVYGLTAQAGGLNDGTLNVTVLPMVRRRSAACTLGGATVTCPIAPALTDLSRTILFFQATPGSADRNPSDDNVSCRLNLNGVSGLAEVICDRFGTQANVAIEWQTVSFPYSYANGGVSVQHVTGSCVFGTPLAMPLDTGVTTAPLLESFVLFSTVSVGGDNDGGDFFQARLTSPTNLQLLQSDASTSCSTTMGFAAQVVSWKGATVSRAVTTGGAAGSFTASQTTANGSPTFLLYSSRMTGDLGGNNNICRRRLRGVITNPGTLTFDRGCTGANIQDISWEHVVLPTGATVQPVAGAMADGVTTHAVTLTTPVDLTRAFAFTGGLGQGGTASGRTDLTADDEVGAALARTVLTSGSQLTFTRSPNNGASAWQGYVVQLSP